MGIGDGAAAGRVCRVSGTVFSLFIFSIVVAICIGISLGQPAGVAAQGIAAVAAPQLNLRAEPGTWSPVIGQVWQGESLTLVAGPTPDDWYQVQTGDRLGWAYGGGLVVGGAGNSGQSVPADVSGERWVDVDRSAQTVTLYEGDAPVASYWAAMGRDASDDGFFATAVGTYHVYEKVGGLNWTDWGGAWVGSWVGFDPDRLNGFHSYSMDETGAVLPDGAAPTGGCVALDPAAADQVFAFVSVGTRVEVHW